MLQNAIVCSYYSGNGLCHFDLLSGRSKLTLKILQLNYENNSFLDHTLKKTTNEAQY